MTYFTTNWLQFIGVRPTRSLFQSKGGYNNVKHVVVAINLFCFIKSHETKSFLLVSSGDNLIRFEIRKPIQIIVLVIERARRQHTCSCEDDGAYRKQVIIDKNHCLSHQPYLHIAPRWCLVNSYLVYLSKTTGAADESSFVYCVKMWWKDVVIGGDSGHLLNCPSIGMSFSTTCFNTISPFMFYKCVFCV